jgi:hypothetical protein
VHGAPIRSLRAFSDYVDLSRSSWPGLAWLGPAIHVLTAPKTWMPGQRRQVLRSLRMVECVAGHDGVKSDSTKSENALVHSVERRFGRAEAAGGRACRELGALVVERQTQRFQKPSSQDMGVQVSPSAPIALWRNGRRGGLKSRCLSRRAGSSPARGTNSRVWRKRKTQDA